MTCDFLIIGGGIAGVSAAARLSHLGRVTLLEAEDHLAHHASGRSAALYEPNYGSAPVVDLSRASGDYLRAANGILSPRGLLMVAGAGERDDFRAEAREMELGDITVAEAQAMVPILNPATIAFAAFADHAWDIDTDLLIRTFLREAKANGAQVLTGARVTALERLPSAWRATTPKGEIEGKTLINAAGAWVGQIAAMAGIAGPCFTPCRRSMARIPAPAVHHVARWPMVFGCGETWYFKPDAGALIVSPADEDPVEPHDAWADDMVLAEGLARYEDKVTAPVTRLLASWAGLRTFSPDRTPVIGRAADDPDFFWLAGQGGYGFQSCAAASQLAADLIAGRPPALGVATVRALSPARFT